MRTIFIFGSHNVNVLQEVKDLSSVHTEVGNRLLYADTQGSLRMMDVFSLYSPQDINQTQSSTGCGLTTIGNSYYIIKPVSFLKFKPTNKTNMLVVWVEYGRGLPI